MKCPIDQTEMEKGFDNTGFWVSGEKPALAFQMVPGREAKFMVAFRCSKCGKIELTTEVK